MHKHGGDYLSSNIRLISNAFYSSNYSKRFKRFIPSFIQNMWKEGEGGKLFGEPKEL